MRRISMALAVSLAAAVTFGAGCSKMPKPAPASSAPVEATVQYGLPSLTEVCFVDNGYSGWALTKTGVYHSVDSGQNWDDVSPSLARGESIGAHAFLNSKTGWLLVASVSTSVKVVTVLCTTDGGQTWARSEIDASQWVVYPTAVTFIDAQQGWAMISYGYAAGSEGVEIFGTNDGGATWMAKASAKYSQDAPGSIPVGGDKTGLMFHDSDNGWLTGNDPSSTPYLFVTHDGGITWARQLLSVPKGMNTEGGASSPRPPVFFSEKEGILPVTFGEDTVLYVTGDGGSTWAPTSAVKGTTFSIVDMKNALVTDGSTLRQTNDGGKSWAEVKLGQRASGMMAIGYTIAQLDSITDKVGWVLMSAPGSSRLLKTADGGLTWR